MSATVGNKEAEDGSLNHQMALRPLTWGARKCQGRWKASLHCRVAISCITSGEAMLYETFGYGAVLVDNSNGYGSGRRGDVESRSGGGLIQIFGRWHDCNIIGGPVSAGLDKCPSQVLQSNKVVMIDVDIARGSSPYRLRRHIGIAAGRLPDCCLARRYCRFRQLHDKAGCDISGRCNLRIGSSDMRHWSHYT